MNYAGKTIAITGSDGFIGRKVLETLKTTQWRGSIQVESFGEIREIRGDVRDPQTFAELSRHVDYLFHFAAPSSQVLFKRNPMLSAETTLMGFINAARACREHGIKLIYPSTGVLSYGKENEYARIRKVMESIHLGEHLNALGLRIFMGYGPGEGHKEQYASPPYLFAREMVAGKRPVIWGDGTQERDVIHIDDLAKAILVLAEECTEPIIDVGTGEGVSFNRMVETINTVLDTEIKPIYVDKPAGYIEKTFADTTALSRYFTPEIDFTTGITSIITELKND